MIDPKDFQIKLYKEMINRLMIHIADVDRYRPDYDEIKRVEFPLCSGRIADEMGLSNSDLIEIGYTEKQIDDIERERAVTKKIRENKEPTAKKPKKKWKSISKVTGVIYKN